MTQTKLPKIKSLQLLLLLPLILSSFVQGCGGYTEKYKSIPTDPISTSSGLINAKLELSGADFFINPDNYLLVSSITHVGPVVTSNKEELFSSDYYPVKTDPPSYFIVELLVDPNGNQVDVDVSSIRIIHGLETYAAESYWLVREAYWYSRGKMNEPERKKFDHEMRTRFRLCYNVDVFSRSSYGKGTEVIMKRPPDPVISGLQALEPSTPSCFILKFNIPPIDPQNKFLFEIGRIQVNSKILSPARVSFGLKKIRDYDMVLPGP